ncbi:2Fe-2S iron-sulfur cluster-binding protein, partial [Eubacterium pyruvativorans]
MSSAWVTQNGTETELTIWPGENLLEALRRGGFFVNAVCGGKGTCGKCRVVLEGKDAARESVLACQTVFSDSIRRILLPEDDGDSMDVETGGRESGSPVIPLPRRKKEGGAEDRYGVCVDLGTTTVVTELYSLTEGRQAGQRSGRNRQSVYGADVISRIQYIQEHEDGLEELTVCIRRQIFDMMREICREAEIPEDRVTEMSLAGNTIMQHIFAGLSPVSIASAPFRPETLFLDGTALDGGSWDLPAENPV